MMKRKSKRPWRVLILLTVFLAIGACWTWYQAQATRYRVDPYYGKLINPAPEEHWAAIDANTRFIAIDTVDALWVKESKTERGIEGPFRFRLHEENEYGTFTAYHRNVASAQNGTGTARVIIGRPFRSFEILGSESQVRWSAQMRPMWPGWYANTLIYATIVAVMAFGALALCKGSMHLVRGLWHRPIGHCPRCGYDLRYCTKPGCPECGAGRDGGRGVSVRESDAQDRGEDQR